MYENNNPFWKRIDNVYNQFENFLCWTKGNEIHKARSWFPRSEALRFLERLAILYGELTIISTKPNEAAGKLQKYTNSMKVVIQGLKGREGIEAFLVLLETSHDLMQQLAVHLEITEELQVENSSLRSRIDELEQTVTEIQQRDGADSPIKIKSSESYQNMTELQELEDFSVNLTELKEAIWFASNYDICVLDVYISKELISKRRKVIVLYDGKYDITQPPLMECVLWRNVRDNDTNARLSVLNWNKFLNDFPLDASTLIAHLSDVNLTSWFNKVSDLVAVMPGAIIVNGKMKPVIEVLKRCVGYCSDGIEEKKTIILSSGVELDLWYRNGYFKKMNNIELGYGISMKGTEENFGTIGGFVKSSSYPEKIGILTCEHVMEAGKRVAKDDPFASTETTFVFPGRGARAARILSLFKKDNPKPKLLDCLLSNCSSLELKAIMGVRPSNDIRLMDVKEFLEREQYEITVPHDDIVACTSYHSQLPVKYGDSSLDIVGVVAAVFIPEEKLPHFSLTNKINNLEPIPLTFNEIHNVFQNTKRQFIKVFNKGVNDSEAQEGTICRPANLAFPYQHSTFLLDQKKSQYMVKYGPNEIGENVKVTLKPMYIINSELQPFGVSGDSGALVHAFSEGLNKKCFAIGTFLGSVDPSNFIATPIDAVINQFSFI